MPTAVKRLLPVVVLGALVLGATGCDLSPPAATVNGVAISQSLLNSVLSTEINNSEAQCAALLEAGSTTSPIGVGSQSDGTSNAVTPSFADNALETLVLEQLETQTLARRGVTITHTDLTAATADYEGQLAGQLQQAQSDGDAPSGCTLSATKVISSQVPGTFLARQATSLADQEVFEVTVGHVNVSQSALESYYRSHLSQVTQACLNVVVAETQTAGQALHDQIATGTSFATASTSSDADQDVGLPAGGQLPCEYPSQVTGQFGSANAAVVNALTAGQLSEPLALTTESTTGATTTLYAVVQMRQHQLVPFATLRSSIREAILSAHVSLVGAALNRLVAEAHVSVDPRYGGWSSKHGITVPTPPAPEFVLNSTVNAPAKPLLNLGGISVNPGSG
jgi:hypothetical protein